MNDEQEEQDDEDSLCDLTDESDQQGRAHPRVTGDPQERAAPALLPDGPSMLLAPRAEPDSVDEYGCGEIADQVRAGYQRQPANGQ